MKTLLRLLHFLRPFSKEILLSILLGVATICSGVGMLGTSAYLIAAAALHPSIAELQVAIVGVRFFGISRAGFRYSERLVSHSVNLRVLSNLREWFYRQVEASTPAELFTQKSGDLLDRILGDLETLENFYVRVVSPVVVAVVICLGVSLFIGTYAVELGLILAAGLFVNGFLLPAEAILLTKGNARKNVQVRSELSSQIVETVQGLEDLQSANAFIYKLEKIKTENETAGKLQLNSAFLAGINSGLSLFILNLTVLILLWAAIPLVTTGSITGIDLAVIIMMATASFESTSNLQQAAQNFNASLESAQRLFSIADLRQPQQYFKTDTMTQIPQKIRFERVSFHYSQDQVFQLQDINFSLERNKKIALVGQSGAGKTSLINLLLKFWSPTDGKIWFDQKNLMEINPDDARSVFGVISQSTTLFNDSMRRNLLLANPVSTDDELYSILGKVGLDDWLMQQPDGLNTWIGEHGQRLSGGEQQRVAIARVLLMKRPFLLLDEPLVHLDSATENKIFPLFFNLFKDCGILFITHDFIHLESMDEILVLDNGLIIEHGSYQELIHSRGKFYQLCELKKEMIPA